MPSRFCFGILSASVARNCLLCLTLLSLLAAGCSTQNTAEFDTGLYSVSWPKAQAAMEARMAEAERIRMKAEVLTGEITLSQALARAVRSDATLAALGQTVAAQKLDAISDACPPDPKVRLRVDDFAGSGDYTGSGNTQQSLRVSQVVELNGKGDARRRVGELEATVTSSKLVVRRLDITLRTSREFYRTLAAQKRLDTYEKYADKLADQVMRIRNMEGMGGATAQVLSRSQVVLASLNAKSARAKAEYAAASNALAATWGDMAVGFESLAGDMESLTLPKPLDELAARLIASPDVYEFEAEKKMHQAERDLAQRYKTPDIELYGGVKREQDSGDHAFFAAIEVELPIWRWSGREIRAAENRAAAADFQRKAVINRNSQLLADAHGKLTGSYELAKTLRELVLPAADTALKAAQQADAEGAEDPWEIIRAIRDISAAEVDYIDALLDYHQARLDTERLTAGESVKQLHR